MKIGIFDSGIGGITLLHQAMITLPREDYIFYADTAHVPYGTKSKQEVIGYVDEVMQFMLEQNCKAVVIACNTATSVAVDLMRKKYDIPIIGIEPAVKPAVEKSHGKRVMVVATPLSVQEEKLKNLVERVDDSHMVDLLPLPQIVSFAERGEFDSPAVYEYMREVTADYDLSLYGEIVLGCTHYNYFKNVFRDIFPQNVQIIDGSEGTVNQLKRILQQKGQLEENAGEVTYYASGQRIASKEQLSKIDRLHERLEAMRMIC